MHQHRIISKGESLRILANERRKAALEKHAAELAKATPEERVKLLERLEREINQELKRRVLRWEPGSLLH